MTSDEQTRHSPEGQYGPLVLTVTIAATFVVAATSTAFVFLVHLPDWAPPVLVGLSVIAVVAAIVLRAQERITTHIRGVERVVADLSERVGERKRTLRLAPTSTGDLAKVAEQAYADGFVDGANEPGTVRALPRRRQDPNGNSHTTHDQG